MSQELIEERNDTISTTVISGNRATQNIQTELSILPTAGQHRYTDGVKTNIPIQTSLTILPQESNTEILPLFSLKPEERTIVLWKKRSQGDGLRQPEDVLDSFNYQELLDECSNEREKEMTLAISSALNMLSKQLLNLKVVYERFLATNLKEVEEKPPKEIEEQSDEETDEEKVEEKPTKISIQITDITLSSFELEKLAADADEFPMDRIYDPIEEIYVPARNIVTFREAYPMPRNTSTVAMFEEELGNYTPSDFESPKKEKQHLGGMFDTDIGRPVPFCPLCICEYEIQSKCPGGCNYFEIWGNLPLNNPPDQLPQVDSFCPPRAMFDYDLFGMSPPSLSLRDRVVRPGGAMLDVDLAEIELPILCTCGRVEDPELECTCDIEKYLLSSWSVQDLICDVCQDDIQNQNVQAMFDTDLLRENDEENLSRDRSVIYGKRPSNETEQDEEKDEENDEEKDEEKDDEKEKKPVTPETKTNVGEITEFAEFTTENIEVSIPEEPGYSFDVELLTDSEITPMWDTDLGRLAVPLDDEDDIESIDSVKNDRAMFDFDLLGASRPEPPIEFRKVKEGGAMFDVDIGIVPDLGNRCFCLLHMLPDCICGCAFEHLFDEFGIVIQEDEDENPCDEETTHIKRPMYDYDLLGGKRPPTDPKFRHIISGAGMFDFDLLYEGEFEFQEVKYNQDMQSLDTENVDVVAMFDYNLYGGIKPVISPKEHTTSKVDIPAEEDIPPGAAMFDNYLNITIESDEVPTSKFPKDDEGRPMFDYDLVSFKDIIEQELEKEIEKEVDVYRIFPMFDIDLDFDIFVNEGGGEDEEDVMVAYEYEANQSDTDEVMHDYNLPGWIKHDPPPPPPYVYKKIELCSPMFDTNLGKDVAVTSLCKCDEEWIEECPCGCKYYEFYKEIKAKQEANKPHKVTSNISNFDERAMFDYDLHGGQRPDVEKWGNISDAPYDPDQDYIGLRGIYNTCMYDTDLGHLVSPQDRPDYLEYFGDEVETFPDGDDCIKLQEVYSDDRAMFDYHLYGGKRPKEPEPRRVIAGAAMFDTDLEYFELTGDENQEIIDIEMLPATFGLRGMFDYDLLGAVVKLGCMDISVEERFDCGCKQCESPMKSEDNLIEEPKDGEPPEPPKSPEVCQCCPKQIIEIKPAREPTCQAVAMSEIRPSEKKNSIKEESERKLKELFPPRKVTQYRDPSDPCQCLKGDKTNLTFTHGDVTCLCKNVYLDRKAKKTSEPSPCPANQSGKLKNEMSNYFSRGVSIPASSYRNRTAPDSNQNKREVPAKNSKISYASTGTSQKGSNPSRVVQGFQNFNDITLEFTEKSRRQQGVVRQVEGVVSGSRQGSFASTASSHMHQTVETHSSVVIRLQPSRSMTRRRRYPQSYTSIKETPSVYQCDVSHRYAPFLTGPLLSQLTQAPTRQGPQDNVTVVLAEHRPHKVGHRHGHRHGRKTAEGSHQVQLTKNKRPAISPVTSTYKTGRELSKETPTFILGSTAVMSDPSDFPFLR